MKTSLKWHSVSWLRAVLFFALLTIFAHFLLLSFPTLAKTEYSPETNNEITEVPSYEIDVSNDHPIQGETIKIKVHQFPQKDSDDTLDFSFYGRHFPLFSLACSENTTQKEQNLEDNQTIGVHVGLLAIPADLKPGRYRIQIKHLEKIITVIDAKFPVQHLRLPSSKDNFFMSSGEKEAIEQAKKTISSFKLWKDSFTQPTHARISAVFGLKRIVNGKLLSDYFHSGLDFAAPLGTPVKACAPGHVILAAKGFKLHGNCICIDHGQGVLSFYIHLKTLAVEKGDTIKQGQLIGTVGQTGRANGPHLHFSLYVNQVATNPCPWFKRIY